MKARLVIAPLGLLLLAGCVTVPRNAGFDTVASSVKDRTGHEIVWNRSSEDDREVEKAVRGLLEKDLTLESAVSVALLNNRTLQATYEDLGVAQADLVQAGLLRNPTLLAEIRFPASPRLPIEFDLVQSFVDLFYIPLRKRVAGAAFEAAKARVTHAALATAADVEAAFFRSQGAEQVLEMRRTIVQATEASADAAQKLREAGNITDLDLANEQSLYAQSRLDLASAEAETLQDREELTVLMGLWGEDSGWKIAARLPDLPEHAEEWAGLESRAIAQRPDLDAARNNIASLAQRMGVEKWEKLVPVLDAHLHYQREPDGARTIGPGIDFSIPIFDRGQAASFGARARLRQAQQRYAALAVEIRSQVRRAFVQMRAARERAGYIAKVVLPLRERVVHQTQLRYNAMFSGVFQLLQAKQSEIEAGREYIEALRDYWVARAALGKALGGPLRMAADAPKNPTAPAPPPAQPKSEHESHRGVNP